MAHGQMSLYVAEQRMVFRSTTGEELSDPPTINGVSKNKLQWIEDELSSLVSAGEGLDTKRQIDLLREYRTRLIADVVTGKVDVRKAAAELPEDDVQDDADESEAEHTSEHPVRCRGDRPVAPTRLPAPFRVLPIWRFLLILRQTETVRL